MSTNNSTQNPQNVKLTDYEREFLTDLSERELPIWAIFYLKGEAAAALLKLQTHKLVFEQQLDNGQRFIHITALGYTFIGATLASAPDNITDAEVK